MNIKMKRLLIALVLGIGLTLGALSLLRAPDAQGHNLFVNDFNGPIVEGGRITVGDATGQNGKEAGGGIVAMQGQLQNLSNPIPANRITIDRDREDWGSIVPYPTDPSEDGGGPDRIDWVTITMAHDCDELFVRYEVHDGPPFNPDSYRYNLFVDVDRDRNTGFIGPGGWLSIGADVLLQSRYDAEGARLGVWDFTGADQETWSWTPINFHSADDEALSGTKRDVEYKLLISDLDVFPDTDVTSFDWVAWADHERGIEDFYPDGGNSGAGGDFYTYSFNYTPTTALSINPERGFYHHTETHSNSYTPLDLTTLRCYGENEGIILINRMFYLEGFVESDINQEYLDAVQADLDTVRQAGLKVIVRFAYTYGPDMEPPYGDASKEWVLRHIEQLAPILQANSDVITAMQAGFIGLWGEWYYTDYFVQDPGKPWEVTPEDWADRREVLFAILDALPSNRMVQVRTPLIKQRIFNRTSPITLAEAHSGNNIARTGHHNDCFLGSETDCGTYHDPITDTKGYLEAETEYLAMGGETAVVNPPRSECPMARGELARFHWSYLNIDYHPDVLASWDDGGCLDEVKRRLGYRLTLVEGTYSDEVRPGEVFAIDIKLRNDGWAAPFNPRLVELWLRHKNSGKLYYATLPDDPRFWLADTSKTYSLNHTICTRINMPRGDYELLLRLPDPKSSLNRRPEYAIRLANDDVWENNTGFNKLGHTITLLPGPPADPPCDSTPRLIPVFKFHLPIVLRNYG